MKKSNRKVPRVLEFRNHEAFIRDLVKKIPAEANKLGREDCLAEDAVCREPISGPKFPLTGKNTGNFDGFRTGLHTIWRSSVSFHGTQWVLVVIASKNNREFREVYQGIVWRLTVIRMG